MDIFPQTHQSIQEVVGETINTFARLSRQYIHINDLINKKFLFVSERSQRLFGFQVGDDFDRIYAPIDPSWHANMREIVQAENAFKAESDDGLHKVVFSFTVPMVIDGRTILYDHDTSIVMRNPEGKPWLTVTMLSPSVHREPGNLLACIEQSYFAYDTDSHRWHPIDLQPLSDQELTMLTYTMRGYTIEQIAELMFRSVDTIKLYRRTMFAKLGVRNMNEAIYHAIRYGLV